MGRRVNMKAPRYGIDRIQEILRRRKGRKQRVAVLCHPASVDRHFNHLVPLVEKEAQVVALFGPQHGIYGETQDNMIEWQDFHDEKGRPIYSLYGETRIPTKESLEDVEAIIIDLFDVGARYYTFIYTMSYVMEVCAQLGKKVILCDRPNPLGGKMVEGPILDLNYRSFVGRFDISTTHGMTIGELAFYFAEKMDPKPDLQIVKVVGWDRKSNFLSNGRPWLLPSPNLPTFEGCRLYPGMCLLEGTSLSEGRGTTRPFELIGAPFFKWNEIEKLYNQHAKTLRLQEIYFHRQGFIPSFHKYKSELCFGAHQIIAQKTDFKAVRHAALLLWVLRKLYGQSWTWNQPPYEYEYDKLPIDILSGSPDLRQTVDESRPLAKLFKEWNESERLFSKLRTKFLLY